MTDDTKSNPPIRTIQDGALKANIWKNEAEKGPFYSTTFTRSYKDQDGNLRDTNSFVGPDLLKVSELAREAYGQTRDLRQQDREAARAEFKENRQETRHTPERTHRR